MISYSALATLAAVALIVMIGENIAPAADIQVRVYVVAVVTSLLAETIGLAPRVLWLVPLWLVALALLGVHVYAEYGVLGVVAVVIAAALLLVFTILIGRFHMRRRERRDLAKAMANVDLAGLNPNYDQAWDTLHEAVLCPRETPWTTQLSEHNRKVAALAVPWLLDRSPTPAIAERLRGLVDLFARGAADPASVEEGRLSSASSWLQAMIRNRDALDRMEAGGGDADLAARLERIRSLKVLAANR